MLNKRNKIILIAIASVIVVSVCAFLIAAPYIRENPEKMPAVILYQLGIHIFEPTFTERKEGRELIGGFKSYESVEEAEKYIHSQNLVARWTTLSADKNPTHEVSVLMVKYYVDLGHSGNLTLGFLNDRLLDVSFLPDEISSYFTALKSERNILIPKVGKLELPSGVIVKLVFNNNRIPFVLWIDARLDKEELAWYERHPYISPNQNQ